MWSFKDMDNINSQGDDAIVLHYGKWRTEFLEMDNN